MQRNAAVHHRSGDLRDGYSLRRRRAEQLVLSAGAPLWLMPCCALACRLSAEATALEAAWLTACSLARLSTQDVPTGALQEGRREPAAVLGKGTAMDSQEFRIMRLFLLLSPDMRLCVLTARSASAAIGASRAPTFAPAGPTAAGPRTRARSPLRSAQRAQPVASWTRLTTTSVRLGAECPVIACACLCADSAARQRGWWKSLQFY